METLISGNKTVVVDDEGFLDDSQIWDEDVARMLASHEGIEQLDENKLKIVHSLREHYKKHESFPILGKICKVSGNRSRDCVSEEFINPMLAWKIAGLPKPSNIFYTSMDGKKYIPNPFY